MVAAATIPDTSSFATMMEFDQPQQSKGSSKRTKPRRGKISREASFGIGDFPDFPSRARGLSEDSFDFTSNSGMDDESDDNENKVPAASASSSSSKRRIMTSLVSGDDDNDFNDSFGSKAFAAVEPKELFAKPNSSSSADNAPVRRKPPARTSSENSAFSMDSCFQDSGFEDFSNNDDEEEGCDFDDGVGEVGPSSAFRDTPKAAPRRNASSELGQKRMQMRKTSGPSPASGLSTFEEQLQKLGSDGNVAEIQTEFDCMSKAVSALTEPSFSSSTGSDHAGGGAAAAASSPFDFDEEWKVIPTSAPSSPRAFGSPHSRTSGRRSSIGVFRVNNMNQSARALGTSPRMPSKEHHDMFSSWQSRSSRTLDSRGSGMAPAKTDRGMLSGWQSSRTLDPESVEADLYGYGDNSKSSPFRSPTNAKDPKDESSDGFKLLVKAKRSSSIDHLAKSSGGSPLFYTPKLSAASQGRRRVSMTSTIPSAMSFAAPPLPPSASRPNHHSSAHHHPPPPSPSPSLPPSGAKMGTMTPGRSQRRSSTGFVPKTPQPTSTGGLCLAPSLNGTATGTIPAAPMSCRRPRRMSFGDDPSSHEHKGDISISSPFSGSSAVAGKPPRDMGAAAAGHSRVGSTPPLPPSSSSSAASSSSSSKAKIRVKDVRRLAKGHIDKTLTAPATGTTESHFEEAFHSPAVTDMNDGLGDDASVESRWEDKPAADGASVSCSARHINKRREQFLAQEEAMDAGSIDVQDLSKSDKSSLTEEERKAAKAARKAKKEAKKKKAKRDAKKKKKTKDDKDKKSKKSRSKSLSHIVDGYDTEGTFASYANTVDKTKGEDDDDDSENSDDGYGTSTERDDDDMSETATEGDLGTSMAEIKLKDLMEIEKSLDRSADANNESIGDDEKSNGWLENYDPEEIAVIGDAGTATVSSDRRKHKKKSKSRKSLLDGFESDGSPETFASQTARKSTKKKSSKKKKIKDDDDKKKRKSKSKKSTDPDAEQSSSKHSKSKKKSKKPSSKSKKSKSKEGDADADAESGCETEFYDEDEATAAITTVDSVEEEEQSDTGDASLDDDDSMYIGLPVDDYGYEAASRICAV